MQLIRLTTLVITFVTSMNTQGSVKNAASSAPVAIEEKLVKTLTVEQQVRSYFSDVPILADMARCESTFRHDAADGYVLRGIVNKSDIGVMQINEKYHLDESVKLGYDLYSLEGNMSFARYLYDKSGVAPWSASQKCWNKSLKSIAEK